MDQTNERILTELADIRRTVEEIKIVEENRLLEDGLLRTLEFSTQMAIIIIQDSKFKYVSRQTENQWGYTLEDLIDRDVMSAVYPDDRQQMRESAIKMLKGQRSTPFAFRALTKNGAIRWITETVASISYHGRRAVMANYMDITEQIESRKRLEELEALEASILEAMPNAVIGLQNRRIIFANDGVESVFGWKAKDLIGQPSRVLYRSDKDYDDVAKYFYTIMEKKRTAMMEFPCRRKNGQDIECAISAARIGKYLNEKNIVVIYEDITERKQAKNELEQSREQLRKLTVHLQSIRERSGPLLPENSTMSWANS